MSIEKLTLLHSNDMHGDFLAERKDGYHEAASQYYPALLRR